MELLKAFYVFLVALVASLYFTPLMQNIALKLNLVDRPDNRKLHTKPTPYLGGVAIYLAFIISILFAIFISKRFKLEFSQRIVGLIFTGGMIVLLGIWDDTKKIKPVIKIIGQIIVSIVIFGYGFKIDLLTNPFGGIIELPMIFSILITAVWITSLINAINLIDGMDGLAAGLTCIAGTILFFVAISMHNIITAFIMAALVASALGFLRYNFYPAKIFMGDAGSMFIGFILAVTAIIDMKLQHKMATVVVLLIPITALAIPVSDTFMAIWRRLAGRTPIFRADKKHLHHRLLNLGLNQKQVTWLLYFISIYFGAIAYLFILIPEKYAFILLILLLMGIFIGVRTIGFIERKVASINRFKNKINGK